MGKIQVKSSIHYLYFISGYYLIRERRRIVTSFGAIDKES